MVSSKHFLICILLAMLRGPTYISSTSNFIVTSASPSSIFSDTSEKIEMETTTELENKYTTYGGESLPNNGTKKVINNISNSKDYLNIESEHTTKAEIDITHTANAKKNSENINIAKNVTTSNKRIYDNMNIGHIVETTSTTTIEMITNSTEKITKNSTTTKFRVECDIQMNNGDPKSVRVDICRCADGYEIIEYDEFKNKINKTCVAVLPETTMKSEEMKTTVSSEEQKEIRTPLLYSTKADYIPSTKPKENEKNRNISFSQIYAKNQTDVNNHNTRFAVIATSSVGSDDNWLDDSYATTKPAMPNIATTLSAATRLRNISDHSTESNTIANQKVSYGEVGTSSTPYIKLSSLARRKEELRANGSQITYYIIGSALVASVSIASGILYLRNLRRNCYYEIEHSA